MTQPYYQVAWNKVCLAYACRAEVEASFTNSRNIINIPFPSYSSLLPLAFILLS